MTSSNQLQIHAATRASAHTLGRSVSTWSTVRPDSVILETEWVLRAAYELDAETVCAAFRRVFGLSNVSLASAQRVAQALAWHEAGLDFADAFQLALSQGHPTLKTFDGQFIKRAKSLGACRVEKP